MCDILFHVGIVCSLSVSHGVAQTVSQSTLQPPSSNLTSFPASHGDWSFTSIPVAPFYCWMVLCAGGVAISSCGLLALRLLLFFLELGWPDALHLCTERLLSLFGRALSMPCGERCLCRLSHSKLPCPSRVHGRLTVSDCATLWVFPIQMSAALGLSLPPIVFKLGSSLTPLLARPSCCSCFPALSLPCPCFVTCGERWSASSSHFCSNLRWSRVEVGCGVLFFLHSVRRLQMDGSRSFADPVLLP